MAFRSSYVFSLGFTLVLAVATSVLAVERTPMRESMCTSFFTVRPDVPMQRGTLQFYLNGMNADIWAHLDRLNTRKLTGFDKVNKAMWKYRPDKLLRDFLKRNLGASDFTAPHHNYARGIFKNISTMKWKPSEEESISRVIGRVAQLDKDFAEENAKQISFGFEVRGSEAITEYLNSVEHVARLYDEKISDVIDKEYPYVTKKRLLGRLVGTGLAAAFLGYMTHAAGSPIEAFQTEGAYSAALSLLVLGMAIDVAYDPFLQTGTYALGTVSKKWQYKYEDKYLGDRYPEDITYLNAIKEMAAGAPSDDSFIYNTLNTRLPDTFLKELNGAFNEKREVQTQEIIDAIHRRKDSSFAIVDGESVKDPIRTLLIDQILFFDGQEPVLVNFIRIPKKTVSAPRKKKQKEVEKERTYEVPGLEGARS